MSRVLPDMSDTDESSATRATNRGGGRLNRRLGPGLHEFLAATLFGLLAAMEWFAGGSLWVGVSQAAVGTMLSARGVEKLFFREVTPIFNWKSAGAASGKERPGDEQSLGHQPLGEQASGEQKARGHTDRQAFRKGLWWVKVSAWAIVLGLFAAYGIPSLVETLVGAPGVLILSGPL